MLIIGVLFQLTACNPEPIRDRLAIDRDDVNINPIQVCPDWTLTSADGTGKPMFVMGPSYDAWYHYVKHPLINEPQDSLAEILVGLKFEQKVMESSDTVLETPIQGKMTINMANDLLDSGRDKKLNMQLIKRKAYRFEFRQAGNKCLIQYLIHPYSGKKYKDFPSAPYVSSITQTESKPNRETPTSASEKKKWFYKFW